MTQTINHPDTVMADGKDIRLRDVNGVNGTHANNVSEKPNYLNGEVKDKATRGKCARLHDQCTVCCIPCLSSHNPLPENASAWERFKHAFMLPPRGNVAFYVQFVVVMLQIWVVLYSLLHAEALPGGNFFSLLMLFIFTAIGGYLISFVNLPPLLGK